MAPLKTSYKKGEPVWASMEGYPWWPGRVVDLDEVIVSAGEPQPVIGENEYLVEFFNDDKRFAVMHYRYLRSFLNERYDNINKGYAGVQYMKDLKGAVDEAEQYRANNNMKKIYKDNKMKKTKSKDLEDNLDAEPDGKKKVKKRRKGEPEEAMPTEEQPKPRKKKKSETNAEREHAPATGKRRRADSSRQMGELKDPLPEEDDALDIPVSKVSISKPEPKEEPTPIRNDDIRIPRRRSRRGDHVEEEDEEKDPEVAAVRNIKNRSRSKSEPEIVLSTGQQEKSRKSSNRVDKDKHSADHAAQEEPRSEESEENRRKAVSERRSKDKVQPTEPNNDEQLDEDALHDEQAAQAESTKLKNEAVGEIGAFSLGGDYQTLSKDALITILEARDKEIRAYRMQLWRYRLDNMKHIGEKDLTRTQQELGAICDPAWEAVSELLEFSRKRKDNADNSDKWNELEQKAVHAVEKLQRTQFDIRLFPESRVAYRAVKFARKAKAYSVELTRVLRDLVVQWVDILRLEEELDDEPIPARTTKDSDGKVKQEAHVASSDRGKDHKGTSGRKAKPERQKAVITEKEDVGMGEHEEGRGDADKMDIDTAREEESKSQKRAASPAEREKEKSEEQVKSEVKQESAEVENGDEKMEEAKKESDTEDKKDEDVTRDTELKDEKEKRNVKTEDVVKRRPRKSEKENEVKKEELKTSLEDDDDRSSKGKGDKEDEVKGKSEESGRSGKMKEDKNVKVENGPSTPPRSGSYKSKSPDVKKIESPSKRREERIKNFSCEVCRDSILNLLGLYKADEVGEKVRGVRKDIADRLEKAITPRKEDDSAGYYDTGRNIVKSLKKAFAHDAGGDEESELEKALTACTNDAKAPRRFVKRLLDGGFTK